MDKKITIMEAYMKFVLCEIYVCSNLIVRKLTSYSMRKSADIRRYARTDRQRHRDRYRQGEYMDRKIDS